jgi:hypothetical protein
MSHWASTWAYEQDVQPCGRKFVLVALADFADEDGFCYPSQETLAKMTGQDVRTVRRHLKSLENDKLIRRSPRWKKTGGRTSDGYGLLAPASRLKPNRTERPLSKRTNCPADKLSGDPSEHKDDPSVKKDPPLPPKGYRVPASPPEEKFDLPPSDFVVTDDLRVWLAEMGFNFSEPELVSLTQAWRESREGKPDRRKRTLAMWRADWKKFARIYWEIRQQNGNGHKQGRDGDDEHPAWMASPKPAGYFEKISAEYQRK